MPLAMRLFSLVLHEPLSQPRDKVQARVPHADALVCERSLDLHRRRLDLLFTRQALAALVPAIGAHISTARLHTSRATLFANEIP